MKRQMKLLTMRSVDALIRKGERGGWLDGDGLYLQILSPNNSSWIFRYQFKGKKRWMGLGPTRTVNLLEARLKQKDERRKLDQGIDPLAERAQRATEAAAKRTFQQVAQEYYAAKSLPWADKTKRSFQQKMEAHVYPKLGRLPIASITTPLILTCIEPLWKAKTETGVKVLQHLARVLDFAEVSGYRSGTNPAQWRGRLEHRLPSPSALTRTTHLPALDYKEMGAFMVELRAVKGIPAQALEFCVLTAARAREVYEMKWNEVDLDAALWVVPEQRQKSRRTHEVPLSRQAIELLKELPREGEYVFIGSKLGRPISNSAMLETLKALRPTVSCHGFRASFRTWSAERTNYDRDVIEEALAHRVGSSTERAYRRTTLLELRSKLMQAWSDYCDAPPVAGEVVPLRARS